MSEPLKYRFPCADCKHCAEAPGSLAATHIRCGWPVPALPVFTSFHWHASEHRTRKSVFGPFAPDARKIECPAWEEK